MPDVWLITGRQSSGKTLMILDIIDRSKRMGFPVCGLVSPGTYIKNKRIAISAVNLETNEKKILADLKPGWDANFPAKKWKIREDVFQWGEKQLQNIDPTEKLFFLDEIGIYEILNQKGWQTGLKIIKGKSYKKAFISVRKEILPEVVNLCEKEDILYKIIDIDDLEKSRQMEILEIIKDLRESQ